MSLRRNGGTLATEAAPILPSSQIKCLEVLLSLSMFGFLAIAAVFTCLRDSNELVNLTGCLLQCELGARSNSPHSERIS